MKIELDRKALTKLLSAFMGISSKSNISETLASLKLIAKNNKLVVVGTDLKSTLVSSVELNVKEEGDCLVKARLLLDALKKCKSDSVKLAYPVKNKLQIKAGKSTTTLVAMPGDSFVNIPSTKVPKQFSMSCDLLREMLEATVPFTGDGAMNPAMGCVCITSVADRLRILATDSRSLATTACKFTQNDKSIHLERVCIDKKSAVELLARLKEYKDTNVIFERANSRLVFHFEGKDTTLIIGIVEGSFPDIDPILNIREPDNVITFDAKELDSEINLVSVVEPTGVVKVNVEDTKVILSVTGEGGISTTELEVEHSEGDIECMFDIPLFRKLLKVFGKNTVDIEFKGPVQPAFLELKGDVTILHAVSPMRNP